MRSTYSYISTHIHTEKVHMRSLPVLENIIAYIVINNISVFFWCVIYIFNTEAVTFYTILVHCLRVLNKIENELRMKENIKK